MSDALWDARHRARQQGRNGEQDSYCPALKELTVQRKSNKPKAVTRGYARAGLGVPMHTAIRPLLRGREGFLEEVINKQASES